MIVCADDMHVSSFVRVIPPYRLHRACHRTRSNSRKVEDMVDQSELLFKLFADYCSDRTADAPLDQAPSQSFPRRYWASLLIKVLVGSSSQEEGRRHRAVQASATLRELAILLDRCKRQGKMDANSLKSVFSLFKSLILVRSALEEKTVDTERASGDPPPSASLGQRTDSKIGKSSSDNKSSSDRKRRRNEDASRGSRKAVRKSLVSDGEDYDDDDGEEEEERGDSSVVLSPHSLRALLLEGWVFLKRLDRCEGDVFAEEVSLPDYRSRIPSPMDLSEIKRRIDRSQYTTLTDINRDVLLMFRNCVTYNQEGSVYAKVTPPPHHDPTIYKLHHRHHLSIDVAG